MKSNDIIQALDIGRKWTRQIKAEEKRPRARGYRASMWTVSRTSLKEVCYDHMEEAWNKASDGGRLPTHWRQVFYVMRPLCDDHPETDRLLTDATFKNILEQYLEDFYPEWDVLRGARGVFKEPHSAEDDHGLSMSTINVRNYLHARSPGATIRPISMRYPTQGAVNRIAAVLICEKEGFDELLMAETVPERYDLALMSTKGISAVAARDLARGLRVPCFTLHDLDKNGFVMAAGFRFATDLGIRLEDVAEWGLVPEAQYHSNPEKARANLLRNGATPEEAEFVAQGQRVELNMFTGPQFVEFVERKLTEHGVRKVIPRDTTLAAAYRRALLCAAINEHIDAANKAKSKPAVPDDLRERVEQLLEEDPELPWDAAIGLLVRAGQGKVEA